MKGILNLDVKNGLYVAGSRSMTGALERDGARVVIQGGSEGLLEVRAVCCLRRPALGSLLFILSCSQ